MLSIDVRAAIAAPALWMLCALSLCVGCTGVDSAQTSARGSAGFISDQPPAVEPVSERDPPDGKQMVAEPHAAATPEPDPGAAPPSPAATPAPPARPAEPTRFLLIGDSQTQKRFGWALDYLLRNGVEASTVATYAVCASTALSWVSGLKHHCGRLERGEEFDAKLNSLDYGETGYIADSTTPLLLDLLHKHKPDVVLIGLGENYKGANNKNIAKISGDLARRVRCYRAGITNERDCRRALAKGLEVAPETSPVRCVWVMPPYTRIKKPIAWMDDYYASIREGIEPDCEGMDTRGMTCVEGHRDDGVFCDTDESRRLYFNDPRSRIWALGVAEETLERLGKPPLPKTLREEVWASWELDDATGAYGIFPIPGPLKGAHKASQELWERQRAAYAAGRRTVKSDH